MALPHGVSAAWAPGFLAKGIKLIDLGADFRLKAAVVYEEWYNQQHPHPELLAEAVYGLPELNRAQIKKARLIGNPGCYPTSILLALAPLLPTDLRADSVIIVDSKSGISGAGRTTKDELHFAEADQDFRAYGLVKHPSTGD